MRGLAGLVIIQHPQILQTMAIEMTYGNGKCIRRIVRLGSHIELQKGLDHALDLLFICIPITGGCLLDLEWSIFRHRDIMVGKGQQYNPASLTDTDGGGDIALEKQLLHRALIGLVEKE